MGQLQFASALPPVQLQVGAPVSQEKIPTTARERCPVVGEQSVVPIKGPYLAT
jgi:hypothetical protein